MSDFVEWVARFPWEDLTRNMVLGSVLTVLLMLQVLLLAEHIQADEMAELAQPLSIVAYLVILYMVLPAIWWLVDGASHYVAGRWLDGGETA